MGTVMEDKIKEAFEEWKKADHPQPKESEQMKQGTTSVSETKKRNAPGGLSQMLQAYIFAHPGVTGRELRHIVAERSPQTPVSYVPAVLKGMFDNNILRREEVPNEEGHYGRSTYAYYVLTDEEREAAQKKAKAKPAKVKGKPGRKPGNAKVKVKAEAVERGITALVPSKRHAAHALDVGPTTLSISISVADGRSYSMTLQDAKFLYKQLNQIFGGVR